MKRKWVILLLVLPVAAGCRIDGNAAGKEKTDASLPVRSRRLQPQDFTYQGAFRMPRNTGGDTWEWSSAAGGLTYRADGDPGGGADGYPGSLFATGHAWRMAVAEITIPAPAVVPGKDASALPEASTLQSFHPVPGRLTKVEDLEIMRSGIEYVPPGVSGITARLFFCWGEHFQEDGSSHGACDPDLSRPGSDGPWRIGNFRIYSVNDYLFRIPAAWADAHSPGRFLATGRFRDGGWSGRGPSLFAIGPGFSGPLPGPGARLDALPLLLYTSTEETDSPRYAMEGYHHSDEWTGGAWVCTQNLRGVLFTGTKGRGNCWYGDSNGPCLDCEGERGWWSDRFEGGFLFYDPDDLAGVAKGEARPHDPQPYAFMVVDDVLFHVVSPQQWHHLGPCAWDGDKGFLYVAEPRADGDRPVIHVWRIAARPE